VRGRLERRYPATLRLQLAREDGAFQLRRLFAIEIEGIQRRVLTATRHEKERVRDLVDQDVEGVIGDNDAGSRPNHIDPAEDLLGLDGEPLGLKGLVLRREVCRERMGRDLGPREGVVLQKDPEGGFRINVDASYGRGLYRSEIPGSKGGPASPVVEVRVEASGLDRSGGSGHPGRREHSHVGLRAHPRHAGEDPGAAGPAPCMARVWRAEVSATSRLRGRSHRGRGGSSSRPTGEGGSGATAGSGRAGERAGIGDAGILACRRRSAAGAEPVSRVRG
jgi:hypothetical protein